MIIHLIIPLLLFAGNTLFISPELLYQEGLLKKEEITNYFLPAKKNIDFKQVYSLKDSLFRKDPSAICKIRDIP